MVAGCGSSDGGGVLGGNGFSEDEAKGWYYAAVWSDESKACRAAVEDLGRQFKGLRGAIDENRRRNDGFYGDWHSDRELYDFVSRKIGEETKQITDEITRHYIKPRAREVRSACAYTQAVMDETLTDRLEDYEDVQWRARRCSSEVDTVVKVSKQFLNPRLGDEIVVWADLQDDFLENCFKELEKEAVEAGIDVRDGEGSGLPMPAVDLEKKKEPRIIPQEDAGFEESIEEFEMRNAVDEAADMAASQTEAEAASTGFAEPRQEVIEQPPAPKYVVRISGERVFADENGSFAAEVKPLHQGRWMRRIGEAYPSRALRNDEQGRVGVWVTVEPDGRARNCRVVSSSGSNWLDEGACDGVVRYGKFDPALSDDGAPISAEWTTSIVYALN